ncbi:unnamed protein product [Allacma fusca]|uniref:Uncharacterized protein n=1 Tax=Allacma fusca TaxID=39272 RepID=A0A8J2KPF1_9HEXA|nr:unnamed protein product [Allacma fusca]
MPSLFRLFCKTRISTAFHKSGRNSSRGELNSFFRNKESSQTFLLLSFTIGKYKHWFIINELIFSLTEGGSALIRKHFFTKANIALVTQN